MMVADVVHDDNGDDDDDDNDDVGWRVVAATAATATLEWHTLTPIHLQLGRILNE